MPDDELSYAGNFLTPMFRRAGCAISPTSARARARRAVYSAR
ncbi:MAG: hypothetical protein U0Z44_13785 [Kouleothrix sp.]